MKPLYKELIVIAICGWLILFFNNRIYEMPFIIIMFGIIVRLRYILKENNIEDKGEILK
jgi:hypothetical protein